MIQLLLVALCAAGSLGPVALAGGKPKYAPPAPVVVRTSDGFDWGDAAIGAGAGIGAVLAAAGAITLAGTRERSD